MDNNYVYHNSHDIFYRHPFGSVPCSEKITIRIKIKGYDEYMHIALRIWIEGLGEKITGMQLIGEEEERIYECIVDTPENPGLIWYYFILADGGNTFYYGNNDKMSGGTGRLYYTNPGSYQITVYDKEYRTPVWFKDCVMYQIFVDRFFNGNDDGNIPVKNGGGKIHKNWNDQPEYLPDLRTGEYLSNDFFGGNLQGIIKKLEYLKALGIDVIYLNPIFESPSNHKYDTSDYMKIDPMFGDNDSFRDLCELSRELGIRIILDGVFSHTGSDSIYFNKLGKYDSLGAFQSVDSPYFSWYRFIKYPDEYECWWGFDTLPNVNELEPSFMDFILRKDNSVVKNWMRLGASGWRLDVADELPDEFLLEFRRTVKNEDKDSVIIGEVWEDASNKISYGVQRQFLSGLELDSVMNYPLRDILIKFLLCECGGKELNCTIMSQYENYPLETFYSLVNLAGSHDTPRIRTVLGEGINNNSISREEEASVILNAEQSMLADKRIKLFSLFQMTFPGVPCIYYGDEAGVQGCRDPFNRGTYPWGKEDDKLLEWYRKITALRHRLDILRTGYFLPLYIDDNIYGFARYLEDGRDVFGRVNNGGFAVILLNRSKSVAFDVKVDLRRWNIEHLINLLDGSEEILTGGFLTTNVLALEGKLFYTPLKT